MSDAIHSPSSEHKQAARAHEIAARQHREAAEFHDKNMLHAARLGSENARECCIQAHRHSLRACEHSEKPQLVQRSSDIRRILDARFSLSGLEYLKDSHARWWESATNDTRRGVYAEAMRELRRLEVASDDELRAEVAAIAP
jgi:hypothetical protein